MKHLSIYTIMLCLILGTLSCVNELDNYKKPNGGIKGQILDKETNEPIPLPVQGSTGTMIKLFELNTEATMSIDFYAKHDGTYEHSKVFNGEYNVVVSGPFVEPCEEKTVVKGQTTFDLKATPYTRINASAKTSGTTITINYDVIKTDNSLIVKEVYGYWNFAPGVDNGSANHAGKMTVNELVGTITFNLENNNNYVNNLHKINANGNKIYLRIGSNTNGQINYSKIITVTL